MASIRSKGVLEPILVRKPDAVDGAPAGVKFEIVAGERRYRAALEAGLFEIPAIELEVTADEALEITLIENLQRKDLNAFEEAEGYQALGTLHSYTQEQIAQAVGRSRSSVAESLSLLVLPPEVRERALELGIQAKSALLELAKVTEPGALDALLTRAGREGLSRDDLRGELRRGVRGQGWSRPQAPLRVQVPRPGQVVPAPAPVPPIDGREVRPDPRPGADPRRDPQYPGRLKPGIQWQDARSKGRKSFRRRRSEKAPRR